MFRMIFRLAVATALVCQMLYNADVARAGTVTVNPGANPLISGNRLVAALAGIPNPSPANPWLLRINPGIYDLNGATLFLRSGVDIEGSGRLSTVIRSTATSAAPLVFCAQGVSAEIRNLSIANRQNFFDSAALISRSSGLRLSQVSILAQGPDVPRGVWVQNSILLADDLTIEISNHPGLGTALRLDGTVANPAGAMLKKLAIKVGSTAGTSIGIQATNAGFSADGLELSVAGTTATGILLGGNGAYLTEVSHARVSAGASAGIAVGLRVNGAAGLNLRDVSAHANGAPGYGVWLGTGSAGATISSSEISGSTNSLRRDNTTFVSIGSTYLHPAVLNNAGANLRCASSYNGFFAPLSAACQ